jgi:hypothetical protein
VDVPLDRPLRWLKAVSGLLVEGCTLDSNKFFSRCVKTVAGNLGVSKAGGAAVAADCLRLGGVAGQIIATGPAASSASTPARPRPLCTLPEAALILLLCRLLCLELLAVGVMVSTVCVVGATCSAGSRSDIGCSLVEGESGSNITTSAVPPCSRSAPNALARSISTLTTGTTAAVTAAGGVAGAAASTSEVASWSVTSSGVLCSGVELAFTRSGSFEDRGDASLELPCSAAASAPGGDAAYSRSPGGVGCGTSPAGRGAVVGAATLTSCCDLADEPWIPLLTEVS